MNKENPQILECWDTFASDSAKYGLKIVGELDDANSNYSFHRLIVWQNEHTKEFRFATSSGCSCPMPFEDFKSWDQLEKLSGTPESLASFMHTAKSFYEGYTPTEDLQEFLHRIEKIVKGDA